MRVLARLLAWAAHRWPEASGVADLRQALAREVWLKEDAMRIMQEERRRRQALEREQEGEGEA